MEYVLDDTIMTVTFCTLCWYLCKTNLQVDRIHTSWQPEMMGTAVYQDLHALKLGIYIIRLNERLFATIVSALVVSSTPGRVQDKDMM